MKTFPSTTATTSEILNGINEGTFYTSSASRLHKLGFGEMTCDISAAEFDINTRYAIQTVTIPSGKKGNLSKYAGKVCEVVVTTLSRSGARVNFFIKAK